MRKIIISMHVSLDGFVGGPNGEMDWIHVDDEIFDLVNGYTMEADVALYGRNTYEMMNAYWPTAADQPNASRHDREHSAWYNEVDKIVLSKTMHGFSTGKTTFIGEDTAEEISKIKNSEGKNILVFGSPSAAHFLMEQNLVDEYWLFVNPILIGHGIPMFSGILSRTHLRLESSRNFPYGVTALHYTVLR